MLACLTLGWVLARPVAAPDAGRTAPPAFRPGQLVIQYKPTATAADRQALRSSLGATRVRPLGRTRVESVRISKLGVEAAVARYRNHPGVEWIEPDYLYRTQVEPDDPSYPEQWGLSNAGQTGGLPGADIRAPQLWDQIHDAQDVVIAIVDTGVDYRHEDLADNIFVNAGEVPDNGIDDDANGLIDDVHGWDFANGDNDPTDDNGHGTHVAGIAGAVGNNGLGTTGVCWRVQLLPLKFLDDEGFGTTADAIAAIDYALSLGVKIINASWGGNNFSNILRQAVQRAQDQGALFVAAAGNSTPGRNNEFSPFYPSSFDLDNIVAVAATDHEDQLASFSHFGITSVDLAAPGVDILSTREGDRYGFLSGTSMATPHVSGALALYKSRFPEIGPGEAKQLLLDNVDLLESLETKVATGGRLNAFRPLADPDDTPPGRVVDLRTADPESHRLDIVWTTSGDDGNVGTATRYEIRMAADPLTDATFKAAAPIEGAPLPEPAGTSMRMRIDGLEPDTVYHFALKVVDEFGNTSALSNVAAGSTVGPPRVSVSPPDVEADLFTGQSTTRQLVLHNDGVGEYVFQVVVRHLQDDPPEIPAGTVTADGTPVVPDGGLIDVETLQPGTWSPAGSAAGNFEVTDATAANGSRYALHGFDATSGHFTGLHHRLGNVRPGYAGLYVRSASRSTADAYFVLREAGGAEAIFFFADNAGRLFVNADVGGNNEILYEENRWYHVEFKNIDFDSRTFDFHVDGVPIQTDVPFRHPFVDSLDRVDVYNFHGGSEAWWDEIQISTEEPPAPVSVDPPTGVVPAGQTLDLTVQFDASRLIGGEYRADILVFGNDPLAPTIRVPARLQVTGAPDIEIETETLDFGALFVGGTTTAPLTVANRGTDLLTITGLSVDQPDFDVEQQGFSLEPNQTGQVELSFSPSVLGPVTGTLTIESDDPDQASVTVGLAGSGLLPPTIDVSPTFLSDELYTGQRGEHPVTITNTGFSDLDWVVAFPDSPHPSLESVRDQVTASHERITDWVPNLYAFLGGDGGVSIADGGHDMYDTGNFISTNLQSIIPYTTGAVNQSAAFGPGGRYFTKKYPGLFLLGADMVGVDAFAITGNLGADGVGFVKGSRMFWYANGISHFGFNKRVYGTQNPSVNHLIVVADSHAGITHEFSESTNSDYHVVNGLAGTTRIYYLLYASFAGEYINDQASLEIFLAFLRSLDYSRAELDVAPIAGRLGPGESAETIVGFDAFGLPTGAYTGSLEILSNDPLHPRVTVDTVLRVRGAPDIAVTESAIHFGELFLGQTRDTTFEVRNEGTEYLIVNEIVGNEPDFTIAPDAFSLGPGDKTVLTATFDPQADGNRVSTIEIRSNDPDEAAVAITLRGLALVPPQLSFTSPSLSVEIDSGESTTRTVTVGNLAGSDLVFTPRIVANSLASVSGAPEPPDGATGGAPTAVAPAPAVDLDDPAPQTTAGDPGPTPSEAFLFRDDFEDGNLDGWLGGGFASASTSPVSTAQAPPAQGATGGSGPDDPAVDDEPIPAVEIAPDPGGAGSDGDPVSQQNHAPFRIDTSAQRLAAGESIDLDITFDATGLLEGSYWADLVIESNDPALSEIRRTLSMVVIGEPLLGSSRDELDFGVVHIGLPATLPFTITNFGSSTLVVTEIVSDDPEFTANATGFVLAPGQSHGVNVTFTPQVPGVDTGTITLHSNSPGDPYTVALVAEAQFAPKVELAGEPLTADLFSGQQSTRVLTLLNDGGEDLLFNTDVVATFGATPPRQLILFDDDIEVGPGGWTNEVYAGADLWHRTASRSQSPTTSWGCFDPARGGYETGQVVSTALVSPPIDLRGVEPPITLWFFERYDTEPVYDQCLVDVSTDGGATWTDLRGTYGNGPSGGTNGWVLRRLPLSAFRDEIVRVRFYFETGDHANNHFPGWFVDDVAVTAEGTPWLAVSPPSGVLAPGASSEVTVTLDAAVPRQVGDYSATVRISTNDPFMPVAERAASLRVRDPPRIAFPGELRTWQSSAELEAAGRSAHPIPVPEPPAGAGSLEVSAVGDYGGVGKTATVNAEAIVLGQLGATAVECATATGSYPLPANRLVGLAADGEVLVELRDSPAVGTGCDAHTHEVTLTYPVARDVVDFGSVPRRGTALRHVTVANNGETVLELHEIRIDHAEIGIPAPPLRVEPLDTADIELSWSPTGSGALDATLEVVSNDPYRPVVALPVRGMAVPSARAELEPQPIVAALPPFGDVVKTRAVQIANVGEADLHVRAAPHPFAALDPPTGIVPPGESRELTVLLGSSQLGAGDYHEPLVLETDDPTAAELELPMTLHVGEIVPERFAIDFSPHFATVANTVEVALELPAGFDPTEIVLESIELSEGVAPLAGQVTYEDLDLDGVIELIVQFDLETFLESLPRDADADTPIPIVGEVLDRTWFRGTTRRGVYPVDP